MGGESTPCPCFARAPVLGILLKPFTATQFIQRNFWILINLHSHRQLNRY